MNIADYIAMQRARRNLSIREFADLSGIPYMQIWRIERGDTNPTLPTLQKLATTLGMSTSQMIQDCEDYKPPLWQFSSDPSIWRFKNIASHPNAIGQVWIQNDGILRMGNCADHGNIEDAWGVKVLFTMDRGLVADLIVILQQYVKTGAL